MVEPGGEDPKFSCSLVYGPVVWQEKEVFWLELSSLDQDVHMPWVCMGDFNDLVRQDEKHGGQVLSSSSSQGLKHFLQIMDFVDLGYVGKKCTWCNKRPGFAILGSVWIEVLQISLGGWPIQMLLFGIMISLPLITCRWYFFSMGWNNTQLKLPNSKTFGQGITLVLQWWQQHVHKIKVFL